jgi:hypothetical protein
MLIRFKVSIASERWSYAPGDVAEFPDDHAVALIEGGNCEAVDVPKPAAPSVKSSKSASA